MVKRIPIAGAAIILAGGAFVGWWIHSEHSYARHVSPEGVTDLRGFLARYGEIDHAFTIERGTTQYFVATLPVGSGLALPSGPPAYVFDSEGRLVDWSGDTGDDSRYKHAWPRDQMHPIEVGVLSRIVEPAGGANGSQPIRSETNRTSSSAGSAR